MTLAHSSACVCFCELFFFFSFAQTFSQQKQTVRSRPCVSLWNYRYCPDLQPKPMTYFDVGTQWQDYLWKREEEARGGGGGGAGVGLQPSLLPD